MSIRFDGESIVNYSSDGYVCYLCFCVVGYVSLRLFLIDFFLGKFIWGFCG